MTSANCTDGLWLTDKVLGATKDWFVLAHKINQPDDLDPSKRFTDNPYQMAFPTFLQLCDHMTGNDDGTPGINGMGAVNKFLANEHCKQRVVLGPAWRQKHQTDVIADFVDALASLIRGTAGAMA